MKTAGSGSSRRPIRDIYDDIDRLFHWNPRALTMHVNHNTSDQTRQPKPFDQHLDESLILKHLVLVPSLPDVFGQVADDALARLKANLDVPPLPGKFLTVPRRDKVESDSLHVQMTNEETVRAFYKDTTAEFCAPLASTLALSSRPRHIRSLISFTESVISKARADPDGALRLNMTRLTPDMSIDNQTLAGLNEVDKYFGDSGPDIGLWEFKSLRAGSKPFMKAVEELAEEPGIYPWQPCVGDGCGSECFTPSGARVVTGARTGFDAQSSPWDSLICQLRLASRETETPCAKPQKRKSPGTETEKHSSPSRTSTDVKRKHAMDMIQQLWAEAVQHDATILILNSGNYEYVCVRHRKSNTLYISNLIHTPTTAKPHYGKLHTGIYIAAIDDTMNRAALLKAAATVGKLPKSWTRTTWGFRNLSLQVKEKLLQDAYNSTRAELYSRHGTSGNGLVLTYTEKKPLRLDRRPLPAVASNGRTAVVAHKAGRTSGKASLPTIRLSTGAEIFDYIFHARLSIGETSLDEHVIVKLGHGRYLRDRLRVEAEAYRFLKEKDVQNLVDVLGFYEAVAPEKGIWSVLVMRDFGKKLESCGKVPKDKFINALDAIHKVGILHGPLERNHLLLRGTNVAIIAFGESENRESFQDDDPTAVGGSRFDKDVIAECRQLQEILKRYYQ